MESWDRIPSSRRLNKHEETRPSSTYRARDGEGANKSRRKTCHEQI
uniref:Uncharacterized protein n=1 Tax=Arundo donax TaxID=35708 RepID=A0A0A8YEB7_ARUDO